MKVGPWSIGLHACQRFSPLAGRDREKHLLGQRLSRCPAPLSKSAETAPGRRRRTAYAAPPARHARFEAPTREARTSETQRAPPHSRSHTSQCPSQGNSSSISNSVRVSQEEIDGFEAPTPVSRTSETQRAPAHSRSHTSQCPSQGNSASISDSVRVSRPGIAGRLDESSHFTTFSSGRTVAAVFADSLPLLISLPQAASRIYHALEAPFKSNETSIDTV
jgi:hypothetical protein